MGDKLEFAEGCFALGRSISILHRFSQRYIDNELKEYNLNKAQVEILIILFRAEIPLNQTRINSYFGYNKATITRLINSLEREGYVTRVQCKKDKREKHISLTEKGWAVDPVIHKILVREEKLFGKILGAEPGHAVRELLHNLAETLKDYQL